jgi:hypothetical protein
MITEMTRRKVPDIESEDFGYDPSPKVRRDLHENNISWDKGGSKAPTIAESSLIGDGFSKKRDTVSVLPASKFKISSRVVHLTKELEKNFTVGRKNMRGRPQVLRPIYSTFETRESMQNAETLHKSSKLVPDDVKASTVRSKFNQAIPTPLVDGTKINKIDPVPYQKVKVGKAKNAFIFAKTVVTKVNSMVEATPLDESVVVTKNQAIRNNPSKFAYNNDHTINIQFVPRLRSNRALGILRKKNPEDKNRE